MLRWLAKRRWNLLDLLAVAIAPAIYTALGLWVVAWFLVMAFVSSVLEAKTGEGEV